MTPALTAQPLNLSPEQRAWVSHLAQIVDYSGPVPQPVFEEPRKEERPESFEDLPSPWS